MRCKLPDTWLCVPGCACWGPGVAACTDVEILRRRIHEVIGEPDWEERRRKFQHLFSCIWSVRSSTNASAIAVVLSEIHAVKDGRWCTVLYDAVQYNEHEHVEQLLNYGACPNLGHVHQNVITLCLRDDSVSRSLLLAAGGFSGTSDARYKEWGRCHARPARIAWMQAVARAWRRRRPLLGLFNPV
jgi:hypothetical protein